VASPDAPFQLRSPPPEASGLASLTRGLGPTYQIPALRGNRREKHVEDAADPRVVVVQ
jgi:hypothetical protein